MREHKGPKNLGQSLQVWSRITAKFHFREGDRIRSEDPLDPMASFKSSCGYIGLKFFLLLSLL